MLAGLATISLLGLQTPSPFPVTKVNKVNVFLFLFFKMEILLLLPQFTSYATALKSKSSRPGGL